MSENLTNEQELAKFKEMINSETPDLGKIKELLSSNPELFSKEQRESFMRTIYSDSAGFEFYGFKDLSKLQTTIKAMNELYAEGKINAEQFKEFLTAPLPESGSSVLTQVALNIRANEFKSVNMQDADALDKLKNASQGYDELLMQISEIDKNILSEALEVKDASKMQVSFADLCAKSEKLQYFMDNNYSLAGYQNQETAQTQDNENTLTVAAAQNEGNLRIGGEQEQPMTVSAQSVPPEKNIADMHTDAPKDNRKPEKIKLEPVREQDIIDFMFNSWFLAGINWAMEKSVNLAQDSINALTANYDTGPRMSASNANNNQPAGGAQAPLSLRNDAALNMINNLPTQIKDDIMQKYPIYQQAMASMIQQNIGKKPKDWEIGEITYPDGSKQKPLDLANPFDIKKIDKWNEMYKANPQNVAAILQSAGKMPSQMEKMVVICTNMAVVDYLSDSQNKDKPLDDKATAKVQKLTLGYLEKFQISVLQIQKALENQYRIQNGISPDAELGPKEQQSIMQSTAEKFGQYLDETCKKSAELKKQVTEYYNPVDEAGQKASAAQIKVARKAFFDSIEDIDKHLVFGKAANTKQDLKSAAVDFNHAEENEGKITAKSAVEMSEINQQLENQKVRRKFVNAFKHKFNKLPSVKDWRSFLKTGKVR